MSTEQQSIVKRIQAILAKRDSLKELQAKATTTEEASKYQNEYEVAASLALKLLKQYQLTEDAIKNFNFSTNKVNASLLDAAKYGLEPIKTLQTWEMALNAVICKYFNVRVMLMNEGLAFLGYEEDRLVAMEVAGYLLYEMRVNATNAWSIFAKNKPNVLLPSLNLNIKDGKTRLTVDNNPMDTYIQSWCIGATTQIAKRLQVVQDSVLKIAAPMAITFEGKKQQAVEDAMNKIKEATKMLTGKDIVKAGEDIASQYHNLKLNSEAYHQGVIFGNTVSIDGTPKKELS